MDGWIWTAKYCIMWKNSVGLQSLINGEHFTNVLQCSESVLWFSLYGKSHKCPNAIMLFGLLGFSQYMSNCNSVFRLCMIYLLAMN